MIRALRCLTILLAASAWSLDLASLKPQGYVSDFAGVLDPQSRVQLERFCGRVEAASGVQMAFVTLATLEGQPIEDAANKLFRQWGIGHKEDRPGVPPQNPGADTPSQQPVRRADEGLLLLLVTGERRSRLEVGYGLEPYITDGTAGELLRAMRPALREQQYGQAMLTAAHSLAERIAQGKGISIAKFEPPPRRQVPESTELPWPVLLGGMFLLFWMMNAGRRGRGYYRGGHGGFIPGLILGNVLNRSAYGGHGRGGFGGYDSGDSFGGFGGGSSGGGGASSDW